MGDFSNGYLKHQKPFNKGIQSNAAVMLFTNLNILLKEAVAKANLLPP